MSIRGIILKYVCVSNTYLRAHNAFRPRFTADRGECDPISISAPLRWAYITRMCYLSEKVSNMSMCVSVKLCNVWVINLRRGRVKVKHGAGVSLLLSKSITVLRQSGLTSSSDRWNASKHTYSFTSYALRRDLKFNLGKFETEVNDLKLCFAIPPKSSPRDRTRGHCGHLE